MPYRVAPRPPSLVTPGDKVPEVATLSQRLRWQPCHGARDGHPAVAPETVAPPQCHSAQDGGATSVPQCPRWRPHLSATLTLTDIVPHAGAGTEENLSIPSSVCFKQLSFPMEDIPHEVVGWGPPVG